MRDKQPEIRKYPEDWEIVKIKELSKVITGNTPPTSSLDSYGGTYLWATPTDINGQKILKHTSRKLTEKGISFARKLPPETLLVTCIASIGKNAILKKEGCCNQQINAILPSEKYNTDYLYYWFENNKKLLLALAGQTAVPIINKNTFEKLSVILPTPKEQQKIAAILTTVDENIEETGRIISACEKIKKGLMQELFSNNASQINYSNKWETTKLKDVVICFKNGGTPSTKNKTYWTGNIPWVTGADFDDGKIRNIRRHITEEAVRNSATNVIKKGNLLLVTRTGVGKMAIAPYDIAISQDITGILFNESILPKFAFWYMRYYIEKLKTLNQGTSINGIVRADLEASQFPIMSNDRQKEIVAILDSLTDRIDEEKEKKETLTTLKKSLMQKLLTGEIRVKVQAQ